MKTFRHGDLSFHKTTKENNLSEVKHNGSFTLALGEHTGHSHVLTKTKGEMKIYQNAEGRYVIEIDGEAELRHPEHKPLIFTSGVYEMKIEQEFDYFLQEIRNVQD